MPDQFTTVTLPICSGLLVLAGLILAQSRAIRSELREAARERTELRNQIGELPERMAHLEGLLEGLREAITRRNVA